MRTLPRLAAMMSVTLPLALLAGCEKAPANPTPGGRPAAPGDGAPAELTAKLSKIINDAGDRYRPLEYEYDEDLLRILDGFEAHLSGKAPGPPPRAMSTLDEGEERAHFRETIRRWEAKSGRSLRAEVDKLKAEIADRKPGKAAFYPEFHKHFAAAFDDLVPIEVAEIRERRDRAIHEKAEPLLDGYREKYPDQVREQEAVLNKPPYDLPRPGPAGEAKS